jgi:hypothetical protein
MDMFDNNMDMFDKELEQRDCHIRKHSGHHAGQYHYSRHRENRHASPAIRGRLNDHHRSDWETPESNAMHPMLGLLMGNRKLIGLLLLFVAALVVLVVGVFVLLFPVTLKVVGLAGEDGLASVLDQVRPVLDTLKLGTAR